MTSGLPATDLALRGLDAMRRNRRWAKGGFPANQAVRHLRTLLDAGVGVVYIGERASPVGGIRLRAPLWRKERAPVVA
ncbi:MAG: hypothetical protein HZC43_03005 [Nitrosomonadales bacterium]|nr:hypothetical protein [Nitrosomonadales bacterium]